MKFMLDNMEEDKAVVRIRVKKCNGSMKPEYKKMSVDPSLTSFDVLHSLLVRAFDIKSNFSISYLTSDERGIDVYLSMLSDWDLEAAIATSCKPYLCLKIDLKPFEKGVEDWDIVQKPDAVSRVVTKTSFTGTFNSFFKSITKVLGLKQDDTSPVHEPQIPPMSDIQFRTFQNKVGCLLHREQFKLAVFQSGVEESLRKVVWRHLLDVYPEQLNGHERLEHLKKKSNKYYELRDSWKSRLASKSLTQDEKQVMNTVKKDVLRTDRHHSFFAGADDNQSSLMLLNLLVTFAFTHPEVSYCQGMSDLASPLLVVQKDEASAYVCFCSLMLRLRSNFLPDGISVSSTFLHLSLLLEHHDRAFAERLKSHRLEADLFFCYRWILLEMKREFPLDDAMYVLEVMWSTLPTHLPDEEGVPLIDADYIVTSTVLCNHARPSLGYINLKRKFSSSSSIDDHASNKNSPENEGGSRKCKAALSPCEECGNVEVVDVHVGEYLELEKQSLAIERSLEFSLFDSKPTAVTPSYQECCGFEVESELQNCEKDNACSSTDLSNEVLKTTADIYQKHYNSFGDVQPHFESKTSHAATDLSQDDKHRSENKIPPSCDRNNFHVSETRTDSKSLRRKLKLDLTSTLEQETAKESREEFEEYCENSHLLALSEKVEGTPEPLPSLPPPQEFGSGNPFLMFLCLALLLQHRDLIMAHKMDYNDVAMFFDRMVRKHDARKVVSQARILYCSYIREQKVQSS